MVTNMTKIDNIIEDILEAEGGFVDHPDDRGGATNWGITERVARASGFSGNMKDLSRDAAKDIYFEKYVVGPGFAEVAKASSVIAAEMTDTGVNMGPRVASMMLQRALNALNNKGIHYQDIAVDGDTGPATIGALKAYLQRRGWEGEMVLLKALNCLQGERYIELAEKRQKNESFVYGWINNRISAVAR